MKLVRKRLSFTHGLALSALLIVAAASIHAGDEIAGKRVIIYYPNWGCYAGHKNFQVGNIPWDKITHINHAFMMVGKDNKLAYTDEWADRNMAFKHSGAFKGHFGEYLYYKRQYPHVKILVSVGGWTKGNNFHKMALTERSRNTFAKSCVSFLKSYQFFDGIDIDWEYPGVDRAKDPRDEYDNGCPGGPEGTQNFTLLLKTLRETFDANGLKDHLLTIAAPAGVELLKRQEPKEYYQYLNFINVMTYDFHGGTAKISNHHSALYRNPNDPGSPEYNVDFVAKYFKDTLGIPAAMLNIGVPYYSHGWKGLKPESGDNGLFAAVAGPATGVWDNPKCPGGINPYYELSQMEQKGFVKYFDEVSRVPWLYNPTTGEIFSYDDGKSLAEKCDYIKTNGYGGIMIWEITGDGPGFPLTNLIFTKMNN